MGEREGRKLETSAPLCSLSCSQSTMAWSLVFLGVIVLLSAFSGPGVGGGPMPKLADRKLCADQECSRKSGEGELGAWGVSLCGGCCIPFYSFPRPYLHGCGPSGLHGPRLPIPDHSPGPSGVCLLQAEGPWAALLGRQCESWESERGKGTGLG